MSLSTSSAEPLKLLRYADAMLLVEDALAAEANRLRGALEHFEATCREPGFCLRVSHVADSLIGYAQQARGIDFWVRDVGVGFQLADGGGMYGPATDAQMCLLPVSAGSATGDIPGETEDEVKRWLQENQGQYSSYAEWKQAFTARFPYLAMVMGLTLTADQWHKLFEHSHQAGMTIKDSLSLLRNLKVREGATYVGQKILYGSDSIKDLAGWSKSLTHLKLPSAFHITEIATSGNVWKLAGKSTLHEMKGVLPTATKGGLVLAIVGIGISGVENWGEYYAKAGLSKVACGTLADTLIDLGGSLGGAGIGALAGAGIGFFFGGPLGAAVGAKIGGFAGSALGGLYAAHYRQESDVDEKFTDYLDDKLPESWDEGLDKIGQKVDDAAQFVGAGLNDVSLTVGTAVVGSAARVEAALAPAVQNIVNLF